MDSLRCLRPSTHLAGILVALACFVTLSSGDGKQVVYEGNKTVVEGDPFTIKCHLTKFDIIKWQLNEQTITSGSEYQMGIEDQVDEKVVAKLSVPQAKHSHSGSYRCTSFYNLSHQVYVLSANSIKANYDFENYKAFEYDKAFFLQCNITASADMKFSLRWFKEDQPIVASEKYTIIDKENKLQISKANDGDVGNYTCQAVNAKTNATEVPVKAVFSVIGKPKISMPEDTPVVEGERLKLHCSVRGNPTPRVTWSINNNMPINTSDSRIKFDDDKNVKGAILIIENVQMADRNNYTCNAQNLAMQAQSSVMGWSYVRVKDKLAALWPFLGICAEVAVLCTIILIYEKKRNKTELDESDTDQSPEHGDGKDGDVEDWVIIPLKPADGAKRAVPLKSVKQTGHPSQTPSTYKQRKGFSPRKSPISANALSRKNTPDHGKDVRQRK